MKPQKLITGIVAVVCVALALAFTRADDDPIKKIVTQLQKWTDTQPQEKVYLHTDKPFYAAGEDIWFKAYVTIGAKHQLSAISNILNVELINDRDSIKRWIKLPIVNGLAWGDLALSDTIKAGNYRIRAYTNYMRNMGEDYFFDKTITIGNSVTNNVFAKVNYDYTTQNGQPQINATITYTDLNGIPYGNKEVNYSVQLDLKNIARGKAITDANGVAKFSFANNTPNMLTAGRLITNLKYADKKTSTQTLPIKAPGNKVDVQFFPEGGGLVAGIRSRVAFKATGADGLGVNIKGVIKDNDNTDVAILGDPHFGMGHFNMVPAAGKTYKAIITNPDGSESTIALPVVAAKGYVLMVTNTDPEKVTVRISVNPEMLADAQGKEVSIVAQQNGVVCYAAKSKLVNTSFASSIPKSRFPTGIVQFTLFSAEGEPLNERVIFVQNADLLKLAVSSDKATYAPRQKVKMTVNATDGSDKPAMGSFSVAVVDESKVPADENAETTILSSLLLTSDLKGYIEKPNYYFTDVSDKTRADLDVLMMTQGYRRFVWKQILGDVFPAQAFAPERSISVTGTIKTSGGKPVPRAKVTMLTSKGGLMFIDTIADEQGKFAFKNLVFQDSARFVIQARTEKGKKDVEIEVDNIAPPAVSRNRNAPDLQISVSNVMTEYLKNSKNIFNEQVRYGVGDHVTVLKEVVIKETKKPMENSSNLNGGGNADQVLKADQLTSCPSLDVCLNGRLNFVVFRGGVPYSTRSPNTPMLIVLDGMQMGDDFTLDNIPAPDVESIEVLRTAAYTAIYGSRAGGGVLIITTKRGGSDNSFNRYAPGIITYAPKGYYKAREFYSPDYDNPKTNAKMADLRTTVFWKPDVYTKKDGNGTFEFFNSDSKGTYRVIVEGIDIDGNIGRQVYRYKVE